MNDKFFKQTGNYQLTAKLLTLTLLIGLSWATSLFVWGIIDERQSRQQVTASEISEQWSRPQTIAGPVLSIPVMKTGLKPNGEPFTETNILTLLPKNLNYDSEIKTETLKRSVYNTPVYTTTINGAGNFTLADIDKNIIADSRVLWDKAVLSINVSDPRGISSMFDIKLEDKSYQLLPASEFTSLNQSGVHTNIIINPNQAEQKFSFTLPLKGSQEISFLPLSEDTAVTIKSDWPAPSFIGEFLPETREINAEGFEASWKITSYGKNLPQSWLNNEILIDSDTLIAKAFGVSMYQEVNFYTMVERSIKYAILFISLTFLTFFMYELLVGLRIHPMQYMLVGLAIAVFYLLLLSLAEIIGFLPAYLISTIANTILITSYCSSFLKTKTRALAIATILISLYSYLYILLQMEQFSLLSGSILLFGVLATVMYLTRNLNWYTLNKPE